MLVFSNRMIESGSFSAAFTPGSDALAMADVAKAGSKWAFVDSDPQVTDKEASDRLAHAFTGRSPVVIYVHGNNNTPETCFKRIALLETLYPRVEFIGFSWPSEGYLSNGSPLPGVDQGNPGDEEDLREVNRSNRKDKGIADRLWRYRRAKINAQESTDAFARFLRLVAGARLQPGTQQFSLAVHSLGAHLFQYTLQEEQATESVGAAHNVILLAPCVRAAGHDDWVTRFRPKGRTYITYCQSDTVLLGAYFADGEQTKLGTDPGPGLVRWGGIRYISFSNSPVGLGSHGYFFKGRSGKKEKLFGRLFGSEADFELPQDHRAVYLDCDEDGSVCYMGGSGPNVG